jgi:hypothetical protein
VPDGRRYSAIFQSQGYVVIPSLSSDEVRRWRQVFTPSHPGGDARASEGTDAIAARCCLSGDALVTVTDALGAAVTYSTCLASDRLIERDWISEALESSPSVAALVCLDPLLPSFGVKAIAGSHRFGGAARPSGRWGRVPASGLHRRLRSDNPRAIPAQTVGVPEGHILIWHPRLVMFVPSEVVAIRNYFFTLVQGPSA